MPEFDISAMNAQEQRTLQAAREKNPDLFIGHPIIDGPNELRRAGIELPSLPTTTGYIRYYPQDFIVEEVHLDKKTISTIEPNGSPFDPRLSQTNIIHADLIKAGISTVDAKNSLAAALQVHENEIGHAGLKDAYAVTAQQMSFQGIPLEVLQKLAIPHLALTRLRPGNQMFKIGELSGNRFTLVVRTDDTVSADTFTKAIEPIKKNGIFNFYGLQRFGFRLCSHYLGLLVLLGEYQKAIESCLFDSGPHDLPFFVELRETARAKAPNWQAIREDYLSCPYTLQYEIRLLEALIEGVKPEHALARIEQQVRLWVYAYMSFLVNRLLSKGLAGKALPPTIPIPLSNTNQDRAPYRAWLDADGVRDEHFKKLVQVFPFLRLNRRMLETKIMPTEIRVTPCPVGIATTFILPKGAYATTLLMHIFLVAWGSPVPEWLRKEAIDAKALFKTGSIEKIRPLLGQYMDRAETDTSTETPES